jgi:hypothetical protein
MRHRFMAPFAVVVALALLTTACGSDDEGESVATLGDGESSVSASPVNDQDLEEALLAFAECMRDEGVNVPDPQIDEDGRLTFGAGIGGIDPNDPDVEAAFEACQDRLPDIGQAIEFDPEQEAALRDAQLEFARCMRDNGVDIPDPTGDGFTMGPDSGIDPTDPDVQAAFEECRPILEEVFAPPGGEG